jgi:hypothetical protein
MTVRCASICKCMARNPAAHVACRARSNGVYLTGRRRAVQHVVDHDGKRNRVGVSVAGGAMTIDGQVRGAGTCREKDRTWTSEAAATECGEECGKAPGARATDGLMNHDLSERRDRQRISGLLSIAIALNAWPLPSAGRQPMPLLPSTSLVDLRSP